MMDKKIVSTLRTILLYVSSEGTSKTIKELKELQREIDYAAIGRMAQPGLWKRLTAYQQEKLVAALDNIMDSTNDIP